MEKSGKTSRMKTVSAISALCAVAIVVPAVLGQDKPRERDVLVIGRGSISIRPDEVTFRVGVESNGSSLESVRKENDMKMNALLKALKDSDVPPRDVVTTDTSLRKYFTPAQDSRTKKDATSFTFTREVLVTLRKVEGAEDVLARVMSAGGNRVSNFSFNDSKRKEHREAALALAITDAIQSADSLCSQFGAKRGKILSISPPQEGLQSFQEPDRVVVTGSLIPTTSEESRGPIQVAAAAFSAGEVKVEASISARFDLE
jgi:uncharacterized protein